MTDRAKALAFAKECLKWPEATEAHHVLTRASAGESFDIDNAAEIQGRIEQFLGERFFIQINRSTTSLFKWTVIVGPQNLRGRPPLFDHGRGDGEHLFDAIFDACVQAVRIHGR
jgi:hypothetical protein